MTSARYKMKNKKTETLTLHFIIRKVCTQTMGSTKRKTNFGVYTDVRTERYQDTTLKNANEED